MVAQPPEAGLVPGRAAALLDQRVERRHHAVVEHLADAGVRRARQRQQLAVAEPLLRVAQRRGDVERDQLAGARGHRGGLRLGGVEHAHARGRALVDERRVAADGLPGPGQRDRPRQRADRPLGQPVRLQRRGRGAERGAQLRADRVAQRREVGALGDEPPLVVLDAEGHPQVRGQRVERPGAARHAHAADLLQPAGEHVEQRPAARLDVVVQRPGGLRHRHERAPELLRQGADQRGDELEPQRGDQPVEAGRP